jgi:hypothetical protein
VDQFDSPSTGAKITEFEGLLLLCTPTEHREAIMTVHGPSDAVVIDLVVLDGPSPGRHETGVLIFQKALQGQFRPKIGTGRMVLGRLGRGQAKAGQSAPWILTEPTADDQAAARAYLDGAVKVAAAQEQPPF